MKDMNIVKAYIERGNNGTYGVYVDLSDDTLNYGIHGNGNTVEEAIEDFEVGYLEMKELYGEEGKDFVEAKFDFHYDNTSFQKVSEGVNDFANNLRMVQFA